MIRPTVNHIIKTYLSFRFRRLEQALEQAEETQCRLLQRLIRTAQETEWGLRYNFGTIRTPEDFARQVPLQDYDTLKPLIERMMMGEENVLWPGVVRWFSKSSGTTSDKSKFIPVSDENLEKCHIKGSWDTMAFLYQDLPDARVFELKSLIMGGSLQPFSPHPETRRGDISAIMIHNMPAVGRPFFTPDFETALLENFEEKMNRMTEIVSQEKDLVLMGGVPTWTVVFIRKVLERTGKNNILEVWPHLQAYVHGGVSFTPYRTQFQEFIPSDSFLYKEVYNASEGYFASQLGRDTDDMVLLLDNGIYYEFIPADQWDVPEPTAIPLSEVKEGKNYAMVISTNSGLWRYQIGDTIRFTSTSPYRIQITGRTRQFVNAFGEEVMVANTDKALEIACARTGSKVAEYTVAPIYFSDAGKGGHEWIIEFEKEPADSNEFADILDASLQEINSDYEAKRFQSMAMNRLVLHKASPGTFLHWMKARGKLGGQHKVPRLANERRFVEELLTIMGNS